MSLLKKWTSEIFKNELEVLKMRNHKDQFYSNLSSSLPSSYFCVPRPHSELQFIFSQSATFSKSIIALKWKISKILHSCHMEGCLIFFVVIGLEVPLQMSIK